MKNQLDITKIAIATFCLICAIAFAVLIITTATAKDEQRHEYSLNDDDTYTVIDMKNDFRDDWFAKKTLIVPSNHKGKTITSIKKIYATGVEEIILSDTIVEISAGAFSDNIALKSITISNNVTKINARTFSGCESLNSIIIPDSVTSIGENAFDGCSSLTSIVIPDCVTSIGDSAFSGCNLLQTIYYKGTAEKWSELAIESSNTCLYNATIYYYSETEPKLNSTQSNYDGNFWHYIEGEVTIWKQ